MNGIIGMTELALATKLDEEQRDYLEMVQLSAASLLNIINDILDFSKIEAGRLELEHIGFHLRQCISDTVTFLHVAAKEKHLELNWSADDNVPDDLVADPGRIRQILTNLVGNAIKFTQRGRIDVHVALEADDDDAATLHFRVSDTGIGIHSEKLDTIFDSFTQADSSTTRKYGGTGLGLAICSELTHMMHGRIWAESTLGLGSTFHFTLRLRKRPHTAGRTTPTPPRTPDTPAFHALSVLVAEDNPINQKVITRLLEREGHTVTLADNGKHVLDHLHAGLNPDVILMDINMPEMDGLEATAVIRQQEKGTARRLPIIALTASALKEDRSMCLQKGMDDFIPKPIEVHALHAALERVMRRHTPPPLQLVTPP
jgi:CheY-like chemotaxis protein